jgi:hypothetical protein
MVINRFHLVLQHGGCCSFGEWCDWVQALSQLASYNCFLGDLEGMELSYFQPTCFTCYLGFDKIIKIASEWCVAGKVLVHDLLNRPREPDW